MKTPRNFLFVSMGTLAVALAVALTVSGRAIAQTIEPLRVVLENVGQIVGDVRITNAADSPVPTRVEGRVEIASSPTAALYTKSALRPVDTFSREVKIDLLSTQVSGTASFSVPFNRLLRIEGFSGFAQVAQPDWQPPLVRFFTTTNGEYVGHLVFANKGAGGWFLYAPGWGGSQAYADPGSTVDVTFSRPVLGPASITGPASMTLTFVGHYIDQ